MAARKRVTKAQQKKVEQEVTRIAAEETAVAIEITAVLIIGAHAKMQKDQKEAITASLDELYRKRGVVNIPPEAKVAMTVGMYGVSVYHHEETQKKIKKAKANAAKEGLISKLMFWRKKDEPEAAPERQPEEKKPEVIELPEQNNKTKEDN